MEIPSFVLTLFGVTGELHGLSRVRSITQDDGHVYCLPDQVMDEIMSIYSVIKRVYQTLEMPLTIRLSLRDPENSDKYLGEDTLWEHAEAQLRDALKQMTEKSFIGLGEAAFYGPKLDFMVTDAIGRQWQVATIQLDFNQPHRFKLAYTDSKGQEQEPIMIHRAIFGSIERFLSILIEHFGGDFPLWLAPVQVAILPISDKFLDYSQQVKDQLVKAGIRVTLDDSSESIGKKIRNAEVQKYPLMLIIGQKEVDSHVVAIRSRADGDKGTLAVEEFFKQFTFSPPK